MARKSKYNQAVIEEKSVVKQRIYKVGVYRRLSVEDGEDEINNSIGNQKKIADDYVLHTPFLHIVKYYADNGYTGMNYKRPGFEEMMNDLYNGVIDTILVKDISRLGRHYILTSELVEKVFPSMKIRLICINDNYDSNEPNADSASLLLPIKMIMNDNYAKDYSKKIRSSINAKMGNGEFLPSAGSIPYGYIRNAEKVTFDIDEETAPVVQRIFEMRAAGMSFNEIAKVLNDEEIPSPGNIRYLRGITKNEKYAKSNWIRGTIRKITNDLVYTGCRIHGRVKRDRLDQNKTRRNQDEWQIIENAHKSIISSDLFEQVKAVNEQEIKKREDFTKREEVEDDMRDTLRDKVFCGDCGSRMSGRKGLGRKTSNNPAFIFFDCNQYQDTGKRKCSSHYIRQEDIMSAVSRCLYGHFKAALDFESLLEEVKLKPKVVSYQRKNLDLVASLRAKMTHLEAKRERMIIDLTEGTLDKSEYEFIHNRLANQISQIQIELEEAQKATKELENIEKSATEWIDMLKNQWYLKGGDIDKKLMDLLINKIIVYDKKTIKVEVNFSDPFAPLQEYIRNVEEVLADAV